MEEDFFQQVHEAVRQIPRSRVASYGQVARWLGKPRGARAVGWALRALPGLSDVPWHRVVNSRGRLSLRDRSRDLQRALLKAEGVTFEPDGSVNMEKSSWDPESLGPGKVRGSQSGEDQARGEVDQG